MVLPAHALIEAAHSFVRHVRAAQEFLHHHDSTNADARYALLLGRLKDARAYLRWNPAAGRPASLLRPRSAQVRAIALRAQALATENDLPELRELVVKPYVLLYAHSEDRVMLLALRHERQLTYEWV